MQFLRDVLPGFKEGLVKVGPNEIAGMLGLPYVGDIFYVDATAGSDTANAGKSADDALATVAAAYNLTTSGAHDVIIIVPTRGTGRTAETTAITWANNFTHLVGNAAPVRQNVRAGVSFSTGG